jgi:hypothetical protein
MGVGYQVSPIHRIIYLDMRDARQRAVGPGESRLVDALAHTPGLKTVTDGPVRTRSLTVERVLAWRQRLATKYRDQLNEELTWNERSNYATSEDVATTADVLFHYAAAVLDQHGQAGLTDLNDQGRAPRDEMEAAFTEADRRGFGGHFPQLLLGANTWLPFQRNLMFEEPNWDAKMDRYGSVSRLVDEITAVRSAIAEANPSVVRSTEADTASENILAVAWQTSSPILRLAALATAKHLPLLTTG